MSYLRCLSYLMLSLCAASALAGEWLHWRGPAQNGYVAATDLPDTWSKDGKNLLWEVPHGTRSTPVVMGDRVHLITYSGDGEEVQERVMALDVKTGKTIWEHRFNVFLTDIVKHRLGWAQISADPATGYVYAQGVQGLFMCLDKEGKIVWQRSLTEELGRISGYGGRTHSPIVDGDMVIIGSCFSSWGKFGRGMHRVMAVDKKTGEMIWWHQSSGAMLDTTYSVPVIAEHNGIRTLFLGFADGTVGALKVATGERIWTYKLSKRGIQTSVLFHDGVVYATHSEENLDSNVMGAVVAIDANGTGDISKTGTLWRRDGLGVGYASPALGDGQLIVAVNKGNLHALNLKTGETEWSFNFGTAAKGSPLLADGKIYISDVPGYWNILSYDTKGAKRLSHEKFLLADGSPEEIYATASVADGRVFLSTKERTFCIASNAKEPTPAKTVKLKKKKAGKATHLQIIPAETYVHEGGSQKYRARTFDAKGNLVGEVDATYSVKGLKGSFAKSTFTAAASDNTQGGDVMATYGDLKASARLRVIPSLPYSEDFEDLPTGIPPAGWISGKPKSQVLERDGGKVLKKMSDRMHPAFARMRNYIMPPMEAGYTIQADMYGESKKRRFWPDMGLINSRYMMRLMGTTRKPVVRLVSWDPMPRIQHDVPFDWKPDQWYTVKMTYDIVDGKGIVRGKVWLRGEAEPDAWTIEMTDPIPNTGGSPGLYGYSTAISETSPGTPVYYDNVKIYKNK